MTLPNELHPGFFTAAGGGFTLDQSLRFSASNLDFQYVPSTTGDRRKWTWATWVKRGLIDSTCGLLGVSAGASDTQQTEIRFESNGFFSLRGYTTLFRQTKNRFRDPNAWYHIVVVLDIANSTANDRIKFYINGQKVTEWDSISNPGTTDEFAINYADNTRLGLRPNGSDPLQGLLAETYFLDGIAITDTGGVIDEFGEYNTYGIWVPKAYTGSFGPNNGYHLKYDSSGYNGSGGIGADHSGSGNNFTASNFDTADVALYSKDTVSSTGSWYSAAATAAAAFDGSTGTFAQTNTSSTSQITFTPSTAIPYTSSVEVFLLGTQASINGGSYQTVTTNQYNTIASGSGTITEISTQGSYGGSLGAIRVDGTVLVDNTDTDVDYFDTPTSNYATLNATNTKVSGTTSISNGNLRISGTANNGYIDAQSTISASGVNCYCEATVIAKSLNGIGVGDVTAAIATGVGSYVVYRESGGVVRYPGNTTLGTHASYDAGDVLGMTITATQVAFYKNGSLQGTYNHSLTGDFFVCGMAYNNGATSTMDFNFGQFPFIYTIPSGFEKLQTNNLTPEPTIKEGKDHFDVVTYTGNSSARSITGLEFQPDFVWIKCRNNTYNHNLFDSVRGATTVLYSDLPDQENSNAQTLTSFDTNGFSLGTNSGVNASASSETFVSWCWKAGGTPSVTYTVKVVSDSGNKYRFNDFGTSAVTLDLEEGGTYVFDQSDSSNANHPLRFSTTSNGTHGGGSEYTTGVVTTGVPGQAGAKTTITVAASAPTLYYYCSVHSGMGGQANTNTTKGSSNFDGTIQSKVTANTDAGFSIVSYTGTNNSKTIGHGLNSAPEMIIVKNRVDSSNWIVYHKGINPAGYPEDWYLMLHVDDGRTLAGDAWGSTAPGSSVYNVGAFNNTNGSGDGMIAYCFHSVEGFSKFGSYTGGGSGSAPGYDGTFVYLGFRPSWLLIKRSNAGGDPWILLDSTRDTNNFAFRASKPDLNDSEISSGDQFATDFLSNGFKCRSNNAAFNLTGATYVYAAFAESPFGGQNVSPATAR